VTNAVVVWETKINVHCLDLNFNTDNFVMQCSSAISHFIDRLKILTVEAKFLAFLHDIHQDYINTNTVK